MTTGKTIALTRWTLVGKVMSLLFNMLSRLVITFLPRSKCLLISWLQSPSAVILEPPPNKVWHCFHCFPIYFPWSDGTVCHDSRWALSKLFHPPLSLTTNKVSGDDGIPAELLKILTDDAVKLLHSISQQIWKTQQWPQDWKKSVFISIPKEGNAKECSSYRTMALISHTSKVMLKILQVRLHNTWTVNFQMFKMVLEKAEQPEIKLPTSTGS